MKSAQLPTLCTLSLLSLSLQAQVPSPTTRTVDTHVASLRAKLEDDPARPRLQTVHGVGYKWVS